MTTEIPGIHHVTAFADSPQENYNFFTDVLGLRFLKRTVRFDVPEKIYHLYYGDGQGTPGTIITYFPMTNMDMDKGVNGKGHMSSTNLTIPEESVDFWTERFDEHGVEYDVVERFDETAIEFTDPDETPLALVTDESDIEPWDDGEVPTEHSIRGMHGVTVHSADPQGTFDVLETMGWERVGRADHPQRGDVVRYKAPAEDVNHAQIVDVLIRPNAPGYVQGIGTYLHVAFRVKNDWEQKEWSQALRDNGYITTSQKDRDYFHSRYITEPGGAIFEYATDGPGFTIDEDLDELGQSLKKPDWLDVDLEYIEEQLPELDTT